MVPGRDAYPNRLAANDARMTPARTGAWEPVTNATDIYSLGVLLYSCWQVSPYRVRSDSPLEIERSVCEEEPEKPSAAVSRIDEKASHDGGTRTVITPQILEKRERLDRRSAAPAWRRSRYDCHEGTSQEPKHRYASVEAFAKDIEWHLSACD